MISPEQFLALLRAQFPVLFSEEYPEGELPPYHLQVGMFARHTQKAIDRDDAASVKECFRIVDDGFRNADPDLKNVIAVSYLEHLNFKDQRTKRRWAFALLTPALKDEYEALQAYLRELFKKRN